MSTVLGNYDLTGVGYLLVQPFGTATLTNGEGQSVLPYAGVDRLPLLTDPSPEIRAFTGEPPIENAALGTAIAEWLDSRAEPTAFICDSGAALRLQKAFRTCSINFDLVYCELAWQKGEENRLSAHRQLNSQPLPLALTYGFDVSWPSCNHSAIRQPGLVSTNPRWLNQLNANGLLDDYTDAVRLREEYLRVCPYPPFDIYLVHKVAAGG